MPNRFVCMFFQPSYSPPCIEIRGQQALNEYLKKQQWG